MLTMEILLSNLIVLTQKKIFFELNLVDVWPCQAERDEDQDEVSLSQQNGTHQRSLQNEVSSLGQVGCTVTLRIIYD